MIKIVVTGSIGMGKSTTAKILLEAANERCPLWKLYDADQAVHQLYQKNGAAVAPIAQLFPEAVEAGAVHREKLAALILHQPKKVKQVEAIVHPLVRQAQMDFIEQCEKEKVKAIIFDIPLFFETNSHKLNWADIIILASVDQQTQKQRTLQRPQMTKEKFEQINQKQMPDSEKRKYADFVVETGGGVENAKQQIIKILDLIEKKL